MATVRAVPVPYTTPQAAHDAAANGDTILIQPGTYSGLRLTKPVHVIGNTDDPCAIPIILRQSTDLKSCGISLGITNWGGISDVLIEGVSPDYGGNSFANYGTNTGGRYVVNRCNLTTTTGANRIVDGNGSVLRMRLIQCTRTVAGRVQQLGASSEVEHFKCQLLTQPVNEGWSLFWDDSVRGASYGYGCGYGDMLRSQFIGQYYGLAGTISDISNEFDFDDWEILLFRESAPASGFLERIYWARTVPDAITGAWAFEYLPRDFRYAVVVNGPASTLGHFWRWYDPALPD